ncbi:hypothetical protein RJT34_32768 [Clitoria ternatea]|uniref:Uncharacterized protein n=1 Tax=Clitoria ternatea TaxID=43366 RepID=A0AAN9EX18_CLITE
MKPRSVLLKTVLLSVFKASRLASTTPPERCSSTFVQQPPTMFRSGWVVAGVDGVGVVPLGKMGGRRSGRCRVVLSGKMGVRGMVPLGKKEHWWGFWFGCTVIVGGSNDGDWFTVVVVWGEVYLKIRLRLWMIGLNGGAWGWK